MIAADSQIGTPSWTIVGTLPFGFSFKYSAFSLSFVGACMRCVLVRVQA